ncbi:DUF805 domain-containing protein [Fluviicoccus sp.]|uniref:DUF805 domain-containing protein n=1 Tax=Fluviicoccus sp. TaxID=2003552 RepID=UPI00351F5BD5
MNFMYGRTLFMSVFVLGSSLSAYIYINYPQMETDVPMHLLIANTSLVLIFIILTILRCHAVGWSGWRALALIIPYVNIVLLFSLMHLAGKKSPKNITNT